MAKPDDDVVLAVDILLTLQRLGLPAWSNASGLGSVRLRFLKNRY